MVKLVLAPSYVEGDWGSKRQKLDVQDQTEDK